MPADFKLRRHQKAIRVSVFDFHAGSNCRRHSASDNSVKRVLINADVCANLDLPLLGQ
jgi:hypothetical protein